MHPEGRYSVAEVSDHFGVTAWTVRRWIHSGQIPAIRIGGPKGYIIKGSDVIAFERSRTMQPGTSPAAV